MHMYEYARGIIIYSMPAARAPDEFKSKLHRMGRSGAAMGVYDRARERASHSYIIYNVMLMMIYYNDD